MGPVQSSGESFSNSLKKLKAAIEGSSGGCAEYDGNIDLIEKLINSKPSPQKYSDPIDEAVKSCREVLKQVGEVQGGLQNVEELPQLTSKMCQEYSSLYSIAGSLASTLDDKEAAKKVYDLARQAGGSILSLLDSIKGAHLKPGDEGAKKRVGVSARQVVKDMTAMMAQIAECSKGQKQVSEAVENVEDIIMDLDASIIFAEAGQLDPLNQNQKFEKFKNEISSLVPKFAEVTKSIVAGTTTSFRDLGNASKFAVENMTSMKESIKNAAMAVTSGDRALQKELLCAAKQIAESLKELLSQSNASCSQKGTNLDDVKTSAKSLAEKINNMVKLTQNVGNEAMRGIRSLNGLKADLDNLMSTIGKGQSSGNALPEEVAALAKQLAIRAAELVSASSSNNQDEIIASVTKFRQNMMELSRAGSAAVNMAPEDKKILMTNALQKATSLIKELVGNIVVYQENNTPEAKASIHNVAKNVATGINQILDAASALIPGGYVDPNDPNVIAERELLAAANSIEAAARKMAALQPPPRAREADEGLNFAEQIIEAVKAISQVTAALLKSAQSAQREIASSSSAGDAAGAEGKRYFSDGMWNDGLVSAAKQVAMGTGDLCEVANAAVQGKVEKERVIAAAKHVSVSTTQLITSASTKCDANSASQVRLKAAGKSVKSAVDNLVKAAEESLLFDTSEQDAKDMMKEGLANNKIFELEAQMNIYKMEQELEKARQRLQGIRKNKYQGGSIRGKAPPKPAE
jgi:talin